MRQLTSSDVEELEDELRRERATVLETIRIRLAGRADDEQSALVDSFAGHDSVVAAAQLDEADRILLRHELAALGAIDAALNRIDFGAGGICILCGRPIPLPRLRADPTTQTCQQCPARVEQAR